MPPNPSPAAPQGQPQQPPFGASPATGPSQNKGYEAAAMQRLGLVLKQLTDLLQLAGATSDIGKDVLKMLNIGAKHVPPGSVSPAAEKGNIERMSMQNQQNNQQMQAVKAQMAQQQGPQGAPQAA